MTREERIAVCYQYTCLLYEEGQAINNQIVREHFPQPDCVSGYRRLPALLMAMT